MPNDNSSNNNVNGTGINNDEGASFGRCPVDEQRRPGRHQATARQKWSKTINRLVMYCKLKSEPNRRGYRKRMMEIWRDKGVFDISEQRLMDQARAIVVNQWLTDVELEEIRREIERENTYVTVDMNDQEERTQLQGEQETRAEAQSDREDRTGNDNDSIEGFDLREDVMLSEEETEQLTTIRTFYVEKKQPPKVTFKTVNKKNIQREIKKLENLIKKVITPTITETNRFIIALIWYVAYKMGLKEREQRPKKDPWWKRRINNDIKQLRTAVSKLERRQNNEMHSNRRMEYINNKYRVKEKGVSVVIEELKQRVVAKAAKIKRYEARNEQQRQNRLFEVDQGRLYQELDRKVRNESLIPDADEARRFWGSIWENPVEHNTQAEWLKDIKEEMTGLNHQQEDIEIEEGKVKEQLKKIPNWKAPGPDGVQGFWIKNLNGLHNRIAEQLNEIMRTGVVPTWMTTGKTLLCVKDTSKGNAADNYRPISCLPLMWKVLTGIVADQIYTYMEERELFPDEQKGCKKKARGTKDQLLIDKTIIKSCKRRHTNLSIAWIDYRKAYDMVPHSWIIECLNMIGVADNLKELIRRSMPRWKTILTAGKQELGEVSIQRGIFQGDCLSPLLFVICLLPMSMILRKCKAGYQLERGKTKINHLLFMDDLKLFAKDENEIDSLVRTVNVFSEDIGMMFGVQKCGVVVMKRGKVVNSDGIQLPNGESIKSVDEEGYKYLGILEIDEIMNQTMKELVQKEYLRRLKKILKSRLNGKNIIIAINTWAVSLLRYGAGLINWTKNEMQELDRKTRKKLTMYGAFHPKSNVNRLYLTRQEGGRGLIGAEETVRSEENSLGWYVMNNAHEIMRSIEKEGILRSNEIKDPKVWKRQNKEQHKNGWMDKPLHGQTAAATKDLMDKDKNWNWLKHAGLKKETESTIFAAQEQAVGTNSVKNIIYKENVSKECRLCGKADETIAHIVSECQQLAQVQYKGWRHDKVAQIVHWKLCQKLGLDYGDRWYNHKVENVIVTEDIRLLWDFPIQTDHRLEHNRPDIVFENKKDRSCLLIDISCPFDTRIERKEKEKIEVYQDLKREIKRLWNVREVKIVPIIIGALGTIGKNFENWLKKIEIECSTELLQKACLLGTAKIVRKVLDT